MRAARPFYDLEAIAASPDVVGLTGDHFPFGLSLDSLELIALALDPRQASHDGEANVVVVKPAWGSHSDATHRWVDADVQVFDVLVDDVDVNATNCEVGVTSTHGAPSPD